MTTDIPKTITHATLNDLDHVADLFEQYRLFYQKTADPIAARDFIKARLENQDSVIFLAQVNDQAAGFIQLYPAFASTAMKKMWLLNDLFVNPAFRQQKIGSLLMAAAKQLAIDTQAHSLKLITAVDNHQAQALYQQLGYRKVTTFDQYTLVVNESIRD